MNARPARTAQASQEALASYGADRPPPGLHSLALIGNLTFKPFFEVVAPVYPIENREDLSFSGVWAGLIVAYDGRSVEPSLVHEAVRVARQVRVPVLFVASASQMDEASMLEAARACDAVVCTSAKLRDRFRSLGLNVLRVRPLRHAGHLSALVLERPGRGRGAIVDRRLDHGSRLRRDPIIRHPSNALMSVLQREPGLLFTSERVPVEVDLTGERISTHDSEILATHAVAGAHPSVACAGAMPTMVRSLTGEVLLDLSEGQASRQSLVAADAAWGRLGIERLRSWFAEQAGSVGVARKMATAPLELDVLSLLRSREELVELVDLVLGSTTLPRVLSVRVEDSLFDQAVWLTRPLRAMIAVRINQPVESAFGRQTSRVVLASSGDLAPAALCAAHLLTLGLRVLRDIDEPLLVELGSPDTEAGCQMFGLERENEGKRA